MVSTYASYDLINRDLYKSIQRVQSQAEIEREKTYFEENIGNVTSVDEFMGDYRLYSFAMKAFGLEEMTYAKAFMQKVLESDLSDSNSFANQLTDSKYREFAQTFRFGTDTAVVQTDAQQEDTISGYKQWIEDEAESANVEAAYFSSAVKNVTNVDEFLQNDRLYEFAIKSFGLDPTHLSKSHVREVLTSDVNDPGSYVNGLTSFRVTYTALANAFNFNTDGSLDSGVSAQTDAQTDSMVENYHLEVPTHVTVAAATYNVTFLEEKMATVTNVSDITGNTRMFNLVKTALGLDVGMDASVFASIVTSDTSASGNYAKTNGGDKWVAIADMFDFDASGNVSGASAMTDANMQLLQDKYWVRYNDKDDDSDKLLYDYYDANLSFADTVDDFFKFPKIYTVALRSVGLDPDTEDKEKIRQVLMSDPYDPESYVNQLKDDRYLELAKSYNYNEDGDMTSPLMALSEGEADKIANSYKYFVTRFDRSEETSKKADEEMDYFGKTISGLESVTELFENDRLVEFLLTSKGLDATNDNIGKLKQYFLSDLTDKNADVNKDTDVRFRELVAAFNFDQEGNLAYVDTSEVQSRGATIETTYAFLRQSMEEQSGAENPGVRLALYFQRSAENINSAYDILADDALLQVFTTSFSLPPSFSNLDLDVQAGLVEKYMNLEDLADPDKLDTFIQRFTALYDLDNSASDPILQVFSGGSASLSADTLYTLSQLRR